MDTVNGQDTIKFLINIVKVLGTLLACAFGLLGLLTEFRDSGTKNITRWGRIALIGIVLSAAVALVSQILEATQDGKDSAAAAKQSAGTN
jgi:predicted outer membrane lipoprotein